MKRVRSLFASAALLGTFALFPARSTAESPIGRAHRTIFDLKIPEVNFTNVSLKDGLEFLRDVTAANIHVNWRAIETAGINQDTNVNMHLRNVTFRKALSLLLSEAAAGSGTLSYYTDQGVIEITTKDIADHDMFTRVYPVEDLVMEIPDFTNAPDLSLLATQTGNGGSGGTTGGSSGGVGGGGSSSSLGGGGGGGLFGGNNNGSSEKTKTREERGQDLVTLVRQVICPDIWRENGGPASIRYYSGKLIVTGPRSVHEALGGYTD